MKLVQKHAVITGASQGLGLAIAQRFVQEGASVLLCSRSAGELAKAVEQIRGKAPAGAAVLSQIADVSSEADVAGLAELAGKEFGRVDVLVANAGVIGPKGGTESVNWDAWVRTISINLLGSVLCCRAFLPFLRKSEHGKILLLSGGGATKPMPYMSAYAASKAAVVRFGETLAEELKEAHIDVNCIAPGALNTRMLGEVLQAGPEKVGRAYYEASQRQQESGGASVERAAGLCAYLASPESDGITGKLISAVWDPWEDFESHRKDLESTDVYTLRRITPGERGFNWG